MRATGRIKLDVINPSRVEKVPSWLAQNSQSLHGGTQSSIIYHKSTEMKVYQSAMVCCPFKRQRLTSSIAKKGFIRRRTDSLFLQVSHVLRLPRFALMFLSHYCVTGTPGFAAS